MHWKTQAWHLSLVQCTHWYAQTLSALLSRRGAGGRAEERAGPRLRHGGRPGLWRQRARGADHARAQRDRAPGGRAGRAPAHAQRPGRHRRHRSHLHRCQVTPYPEHGTEKHMRNEQGALETSRASAGRHLAHADACWLCICIPTPFGMRSVCCPRLQAAERPIQMHSALCSFEQEAARRAGISDCASALQGTSAATARWACGWARARRWTTSSPA